VFLRIFVIVLSLHILFIYLVHFNRE